MAMIGNRMCSGGVDEVLALAFGRHEDQLAVLLAWEFAAVGAEPSARFDLESLNFHSSNSFWIACESNDAYDLP
jgi:hypothetical protein